MTTIRYFIPEDGDVEHQPNVFLAPRSHQPLTLGSIKHAFPLPGRYHFRFKTALSGGDSKGFAVWMDVTDDRQPVPSIRGTHVAKVTRMGVDDDEEDDDEEDEATFRQTATNMVSPPAPAPAAAAAAHFDIFDQQQPAAAPQQQQQGNLLGTANHHHHGVASAPASGGSLLDMNFNAPQPSNASASSDFLGGYPQQQQQQQRQQQQQANSFDLGGAFF